MLGSFYNVVIYRLSRKMSLVKPGSSCPHCGHRLGAGELIPVLSFLWQKGRCKSCGSRISL
ncbi:prepilin peptidase, partial [Candidatus Darwinibacter acetoxidans]